MKKYIVIFLVMSVIIGGCVKKGHEDTKPQTRSDLWALLIGVSEYKKFDELERRVQDLGFASNDAIEMKNILQQTIGLPSFQTELLLNEDATKVNILDRMTNWLTGVHPNDTVIIYFSGHGSALADLDGDEGDGYDECLLPHDTDRTDPTTVLLDDELADVLSLIPAKYIILIFDSCHSGGALRGFGNDNILVAEMMPSTLEDVEPYFRGKFVPMMRSDQVDIDVRGPENVRTANYAGVRTTNYEEMAPFGQIFLAACQPNQLSVEISSLGHGAFTFYLIHGLREGYADLDMDHRISIEEWFDYTSSAMLSSNISQQPVYLSSIEEDVWLR